MAELAAESKINFTFSTDKSTKKQFDELCGEIGISMSAALNAMMKQAIRRQEMSFSVLDENGFTASEAAVLKNRIREMRQGYGVPHELIGEENE